MKERPLLFSAPMVRAILEGRKTQTRRVVKPQPMFVQPLTDGRFETSPDGGFDHGVGYLKMHYGSPGDQLWVKETFGLGSENNICHRSDEELFFRATDPAWDEEETGFRWKPSIFMRREYSRITLEITGVRVERLQEISDSDAKAEGVTIKVDAVAASAFIRGEQTPAQLEYWALWESINGKGSWSLNPWVWVLNFKKV